MHRVGWNVVNVSWNDVGVLYWDGLCMFDSTFADGFPRCSLLGPSVLFGMEWNSSITKSQRVRAGIPSMREPAPRETISDSVELCETEVCFLHIQLVGTNVWLPKMHRTRPDVDFESSRSPAKSESWHNPSTLLCCISHITVLSVFTCRVNVRDQTRQAFVTCFCPFCCSTRKFVHRPQNVRSSNTSQIHTFENNLWPNCRQFSHWLIFLLFELMKSWSRTYPCSLSQWYYLLYPLCEGNPNTRGRWLKLVLPDQRLPWEFSKSVLCFLFFLPVWYRPHTQIGIVLLLGWQINIPS